MIEPVAVHAVLAAALLLVAAPSAAAVFEVGDNGAVTRLDAPVAGIAAARGRSHTVLPERARRFAPDVARAGQRFEISPALIDAVARVESHYDPAALSRAKAFGIMQLMPATARAVGVDRTDPVANIHGGTAYLRLLLDRFDGDLVRTIAAYNAGPAAIERAGGVPHYRETIAYVAAVMDRLAAAAQ